MDFDSNKIESGRKSWTVYQMGIVGVLFLANIFAYMDRVNLSVVLPVWIKQYSLAPAVAGLLASVFNWSLMFCLLFSGPIIDRWKPKRILPIGVGLWSFATLLTGVTVQLPVLVFSRAILGIGESVLLPGATHVISRNFSKAHQGNAIGTYFSGNKVGLTVGTPLAAIILATTNWHWVFYLTGIISAIWLIFWFAVYRQEKEIIREDEISKKDSIKWRELLTYRATWALMIGQAGYLYIFYVFVTWLPSYFVLQLHMTALTSGFTSVLPFIVSVFTTIFAGWVSDQLIRKGCSLTVVRKSFIAGGLICATIFIIAASYSTSSLAAITFLVLSMGSLGCSTANLNALPIDMSPPQMVSSVASLANFGGNVGGALAPVVTGILLGATHNFQIPLLVTGIFALVVGAGSYLFFLPKVEPFTKKEQSPLKESVESTL
jgi:ACS family D-galactonate transporter-like MFS transporter